MKLATAKIMQELDRLTIEEVGVPGIVLMENAGYGCARILMEFFKEEIAEGVKIVCGSGNNGGDGFVIGRHLWNQGYDVEFYLLASPDAVSGDAKINLDIAHNLDMPIVVLDTDEKVEQLYDLIDGAGLIVDAIFGTGLTREVEGHFAAAIDAINESDAPVFCVDIPSGINTDNGKIMGTAVYGSATGTFAMPKVGQWLNPGKEYCGSLYVIEISIPPNMIEEADIPFNLITESDIMVQFLPREQESHKGSYGHVMIVGGSMGFTGAASMAGEAANRAGAGLVSVACPAGLNSIFEMKLTEVMTIPLQENKQGALHEDACDTILSNAANKSCIAIGPGLGKYNSTHKMLRKLLPQIEGTIVLDADGLNLIADDPSVLKQTKAKLVLTPHPGEMSRLCGKPAKEVIENWLTIPQEFAREHNCIVVLKGSRTVVADPTGNIYLNSTGNAAMATGGAGDVLTGIIASYIAQNRSLIDAVLAAVYVHGKSGDMARLQLGEKGVVATDLIEFLPLAQREIESLFADDLADTDEHHHH